MSQQVIVDRDILMRGAAGHQPNVKGPIMSELKIFDETFMADASENDWDEEETGSTIAHAAVDGGAETITGDNAATDDLGELSNTAQWEPQFNCGVEIKAKISQITNCCIALGFVDEKNATDDEIAGEIDNTTLQTPTVTDDAALFIFDTDQDSDVWYVGAVKASVPGTALAAVSNTTATKAIAPVANTYFRVRVQIDSVGNCTFYYNGEPVGYLPTAITVTAGTVLTPYVGFMQHVQGAQVCTISRITTWQDCS